MLILALQAFSKMKMLKIRHICCQRLHFLIFFALYKCSPSLSSMDSMISFNTDTAMTIVTFLLLTPNNLSTSLNIVLH